MTKSLVPLRCLSSLAVCIFRMYCVSSSTLVVAQTASLDQSYCIYNRTKNYQVAVMSRSGNVTLAPGAHVCCTQSNGLCTPKQPVAWLVEVRNSGKRSECSSNKERAAPIELTRPGSYLLVRAGRVPVQVASEQPRTEAATVEIDVLTSDARLVASIACKPVQ